MIKSLGPHLAVVDYHAYFEKLTGRFSDESGIEPDENRPGLFFHNWGINNLEDKKFGAQ